MLPHKYMFSLIWQNFYEKIFKDFPIYTKIYPPPPPWPNPKPRDQDFKKLDALGMAPH